MPFHTDPTAVATDRLATSLRAWLERSAGATTPVEIRAGALVYELAAMIARDARTEAAACALVDQWAAVMKSQIRLFGVGVEHP